MHKVTLLINKKKVTIVTDAIVMHRLNNLLFCLAFYNENSLNIKSVLNRFKFLKPVEGRGLVHKISLNNNPVIAEPPIPKISMLLISFDISLLIEEFWLK